MWGFAAENSSAVAIVVARLLRRFFGPFLTVTGERGDVFGVAQYLGHAAEATAFDADLLHQGIDHRRLHAIAQRRVDDLVGDIAARRPALDAVDMEDLDAFDLLKRTHAFAHDAFDALQKLLAQTAGARRFAQQVLGLVELTRPRRIDLVSFGRRESAYLLRFRRRLGGDLLRFGEASGGAHFGLRLGGDAE